jgi:hypothetical protein
MDNLRREIRKILKEAMTSDHYMERIYDRFLNQSILTVGYEIEGTKGEYTPVGTYVLSDANKAQIRQNAQLVENYKFPRNKSYGVKIADIMIDKNQVQYLDESAKLEAKNKVLVFLDEKTESNGNVIYAIIREGELKTIYFAKSYVVQDAAKMRVDVIIKNLDVIKQGKVR